MQAPVQSPITALSIVMSFENEKSLYDLISEMDFTPVSNAKYYSWIDFYNVLARLDENEIKVDEHIITSFYISDKGVLELYDYELNIRHVDGSNADGFILNKTGKADINDVKPSIVKKLRLCHLETISPNDSLTVNDFMRYFDQLRNSDDITERINSCVQEFYESKLFFEIY